MHQETSPNEYLRAATIAAMSDDELRAAYLRAAALLRERRALMVAFALADLARIISERGVAL